MHDGNTRGLLEKCV